MTMETLNSLLKKGLLGVSWSAGWILFRATSQSWPLTIGSGPGLLPPHRSLAMLSLQKWMESPRQAQYIILDLIVRARGRVPYAGM
jgi:hypothetical protein